MSKYPAAEDIGQNSIKFSFVKFHVQQYLPTIILTCIQNSFNTLPESYKG